MTDHNELAARIERAEGPELRELECRVWALLDSTGLSFETMRAAVPDLNHWAAAPVLRSIDAAMQLVPDGMFARLFCEAGQAIIVKPFSGGWLEVSRSALCPDIAQALCAAAIRARSAS